jgi:hypothetical protein
MRFIGFGFIEPQGWKQEMLSKAISKNTNILEKMYERRGIKLPPDVQSLIHDFYPIAYDAAKGSTNGGLQVLKISPKSVAVGLLSNVNKVLEPNFLINLPGKEFSMANLVARKIVDQGLDDYRVGKTTPGTIQTASLNPNRFSEKVEAEKEKIKALYNS